MGKGGALRYGRLANVQRNAGIAFRAVPIAPVPLDLAKPHRELIDRRLDLLEAEHVRLFPVDELLKLCLTRAISVHVPRCDLHERPRYTSDPKSGVLPRRFFPALSPTSRNRCRLLILAHCLL